MASHAFKQLRLGSLAAAAALALTAQAANVKPVTWDEIANDAKTTGDVLTYGLGLTAQRYSPAKTLNTKNVSGLVPVWSYSFGGEKQRGQVLLTGEPREAMASLEGRIWRRVVPKGDLARYQQDHIVLSSRLVAGQPVIHVLADVRPEEGFESIAPNLEDVYFGRLRAQAADAAVAA